MTRSLKKQWKDKRYNYDRRISWYDSQGADIRLKLEDMNVGLVHVFPKN